MDADVAGVISNGDLGWCAPAPIAQDAKRIHMYHGTYRGQAEAIRPFISRRGYLYLKWWCSGVLERLGGRKRIVLCNSDQTREEVSRFFGHDGTVVWLPLDTAHFRPMDMQTVPDGRLAFREWNDWDIRRKHLADEELLCGSWI